ncbi:response regulator [Aquimarina gracilis]|uniref:Response regulator n=1 Tax=Aquimarina gracilis TaxID=874422 RepID=A0ABU5ZW63_9FLAO|nr:response regulator [Aquimarina gracilis]MEB3346112.1 response regulator [Aquimarina gracilis]
MERKIQHVVLIDDNKTTNFLNTYLMLKSKRFAKIESYTEAPEVLHMLQNTPSFEPDLIFLDLNMPIMTGWEFLAEFQKLVPKKRSKTKIFVLTSTICNEWKSRITPNNLEEYLIKPLNLDLIESLCFKHFESTYYI